MTDRKKTKIVTGMFLMLSLMLIGLASAQVEVTYPSSGLVSLNPYVPSYNIEFENQNMTETPDVSLTLSSGISSVVQLSASSVQDIASHKSVTISIISGATGGSYEGTLYWSDNGHPTSSGSVQISAVLPQVENTTTVKSDLIVFPTSKVVTVQQGSEKTQNILITVPSSYPRPVTIQSVDFNPGTETILFGDLNLGIVSPGSSIQIPIVFSGKDAQTGTYQTQLSIFATDSEGQVVLPSISLVLQVTAGVTPVTGNTFSTPPTCSLSATTLNLNNTYSFTCSGVVSNLVIDIPSSEYYIGKNVEVSSGLYRYDFAPIKYGETKFKADFKYNGASIFAPFNQDIRITSAGSLIAGTTLKFIFTPQLEQATGEEESYLIQVVDNKSGSLVTDPQVFIDAIQINTSSSYTFEYPFKTNKNYTIRAKASGYEDLVETISINPQKIEIRINPGSGDTSTMFNITTSVDNATITIKGNTYNGFYYGVLPGGSVEITAKKDGYKTEVINFTVNDKPRIVSFGGEFKKGIQQNFTLNKNATWTVYFKKNLEAQERSEFSKGVGGVIQFTPDKKGIYTIEADGINIGTYEITGFSFKDKWLGLSAWIWLVVGGIIVLFIIILAVRKKMRDDYYGGGHGQDDSGLSFNVGDN